MRSILTITKVSYVADDRIKMNKNAVLVSPARSGSTFVTRLLNQVDGVIALDEPFDRSDVDGKSKKDFVETVISAFGQQRDLISSTGEAMSTRSQTHKQIVGHYSKEAIDGIRPRQVTFGRITVDPGASDYQLIFKHTIPFTGVLEALSERVPTWVLVRNPLAILASWNTIDAAYREGRIQPYSAKLVDGLAEELDNIDDALDRQIHLLDWHFEKFIPLKKEGRIIHYEEIVETRGRALGVIEPAASKLDLDLKSRNDSELYRRLPLRRYADKLLKSDGALLEFYDREEIENFCSSVVSA